MIESEMLAAKHENTVSDASVQFKLAEYDRLKGLEAAEWSAYYNRFNLFMTVSLALAGAYITLVTASAAAVPVNSPLPELLGLIILIWGVFTFLGVTDSSYTIRHYINALNKLQDYFVDCDEGIEERLYFRKATTPALYRDPGRMQGLLARYVLRGSPKMVLAILDSGLAAALVARWLYWRGTTILACAVVAGVLFVLIGVLHAILGEWIYSREYLA